MFMFHFKITENELVNKSDYHYYHGHTKEAFQVRSNHKTVDIP